MPHSLNEDIKNEAKEDSQIPLPEEFNILQYPSRCWIFEFTVEKNQKPTCKWNKMPNVANSAQIMK